MSSDLIFCHNCGKQIEDVSKFCKFCGSAVNTDEQGVNSGIAISTLPQTSTQKKMLDLPKFDVKSTFYKGSVFSITGTVIDLNERTESNTQGYIQGSSAGRGSVQGQIWTNVDVVRKIYIQTDDGQEVSFSCANADCDIRPGHRITVISCDYSTPKFLSGFLGGGQVEVIVVNHKTELMYALTNLGFKFGYGRIILLTALTLLANLYLIIMGFLGFLFIGVVGMLLTGAPEFLDVTMILVVALILLYLACILPQNSIYLLFLKQVLKKANIIANKALE